MKQSFKKHQHKEFKKYFAIKEEKWKYDEIYTKKTIKYLKFIKWIPWLKMIWIWNSISMNTGKESSDIDLFIVTRENHMRFVRIIVTLIFQVLWVRKTAKKHAWRFCLSFFATDRWLNFSDFAIENDIYLYFWIVYFKPILDYDNTYKKFLKENENWADLKDYELIIEENKKGIIYKWDKKYNCKIIIFFDKLLKNIFLKKTKKGFQKLWKPFWVIINDNMLKFHDKDVRKKVRKKLIK